MRSGNRGKISIDAGEQCFGCHVFFPAQQLPYRHGTKLFWPSNGEPKYEVMRAAVGGVVILDEIVPARKAMAARREERCNPPACRSGRPAGVDFLCFDAADRGEPLQLHQYHQGAR